MASQRIAVLFGGRSGEHDVSLRSAASIMQALSDNNHNVFPVGITRDGRWLAGGDPMAALLNKQVPGDCYFTSVITDPVEPGFLLWKNGDDGSKEVIAYEKVDLVFPVLHGTYGEDGTVQGLLDMAGIPYIGAGVLASATGMDKVVMKEIFLRNGLPVGDYLHFMSNRWQTGQSGIIAAVEEEISYPCFIKPANLGSSVGISKAYSRDQLLAGIDEALLYDEKVLVEAHIPGREIECSVLGDMEAFASLPGEIVPNTDFYDYHSKYIDDRSELIIPAELTPETVSEIKRLAIEAFKALSVSGMARVDFFVDSENGKIVLNEINTIPGFTSISMYPKLWEASGVGYAQLVERLVQIALARYERRSKLITIPPV